MYQNILIKLLRLVLKLNNYNNPDYKTNGEQWLIQSIVNNKDYKLCEKLTIFDVGANKGHYTALVETILKKIDRDYSIYSFEPNPQLAQILGERFYENENINVIDCGLGSANKSSVLNIPGQSHSMSSFYLRDIDKFKGSSLQKIQVNIQSLDNFVKKNSIQQIDLLKIDVEGYELECLKGAIHSIDSKIIRIIQFEFGGTMIDAKIHFKNFYDYFNCRGYLIGRLLKKSIHWYDTYDEIYEQFSYANYIAMPIESTLAQ